MSGIFHRAEGNRTVFQRIGTAIADFAHHITPGKSFRSMLPLVSLLALPVVALPACGGGAGGSKDGSVSDRDGNGNMHDGNGNMHDGMADGSNNKRSALIAFSAVGSNNQQDVFAAIPGEEATNLSNNIDDGDLSPSWSSDGRMLAFGGLNLKIRDHQTGVITPLTSVLDGVGHPSFSPDGSKIAYTEAEGGTIRIKVANADGSGTPTTVYDVPGHYAYSPTFSPDGSKIAFAIYTGVSYEIVTTDINGGNRTQILVGNLSDASFGGFGALAWTRDGTKIMYTESGALSIADNGVFAVLVDQPHTVSTITPNAKKGTRMSQSSDGAEIVFSAEYENDLAIWICCDLKVVGMDSKGEATLISHEEMGDTARIMRDPAWRPVE